MRHYFWVMISLIVVSECFGQVSEIKSASGKSHSGGGDGHTSSSLGSGLAIDLIINSADMLIDWQKTKLQARPQNPSIISFEVIALAAIQPSSYYIVNPRIRGNWGLFSSDFRMTYIVEEGVDGVRHIRTDDWQIIELNIVTHPNANFYVGWGFLHEAFGEENYYNELTTCLRISPRNFPLTFQVEYRHSEPRIEFNGNVQYPVLRKGKSNLSLMGGGAIQQYYSTVKVWGVQAGIMLKIY